MVILGLTGSIGMGKTTASRMLEEMGVPVCSSDALVHRLLAKGGDAVAAIAESFPQAVVRGAVDRAVLGAAVFANPLALRRLEGILHPKVQAAQERFIRQAARRREPVVCLDIPLLFETGAERRVDRVVVVSAPACVQRARVLARPGMTAQRLAAVLARQMPDGEKRRRADFVVPTGLGRRVTRAALRRVLAAVRGLRPRHWPDGDHRWRSGRL